MVSREGRGSRCGLDERLRPRGDPGQQKTEPIGQRKLRRRPAGPRRPVGRARRAATHQVVTEALFCAEHGWRPQTEAYACGPMRDEGGYHSTHAADEARWAGSIVDSQDDDGSWGVPVDGEDPYHRYHATMISAWALAEWNAARSVAGE